MKPTEADSPRGDDVRYPSGQPAPVTETDPHHGPSYAHPVPVRTLITTFVLLVLLTIITVVVNEMELGAIEIWVALGIATVKGLLVVLIFMHMWWDKPFNRLVFVAGFLFFALFVGFTLRDATAYRPLVEDYPYSSRPPEPPPSLR